jgi:hypothetical protein
VHRRREVLGPPPTMTQRRTRGRKSSVAARPSVSEKGSAGVSPNYDTSQHAHAPKKAKSITAARPSAAETGGSGVFPDCDTTQHARKPKKAKPSTTARPSSSEKGFRGLPELRHITACTHAEEFQAEHNG